ncbi:hypothetical protein AVEN_270566-1 [Araneus ventricosus]|uniref:Uncharacterized protein n=1 Tax=Araneus ventricosus TaxID=182803 RepID=A0A4Y2B5K0_ARAVE|nr:hypothetical protein AVEN_270566-1 [Araneus ventricosus]
MELTKPGTLSCIIIGHSKNSALLAVGSPSVRCCNICILHGCRLLACKISMALRRETRGLFHRTPGHASSTCVDIPSSVAVFGLPDLLAPTTEPVLLNFLINFIMVT